MSKKDYFKNIPDVVELLIVNYSGVMYIADANHASSIVTLMKCIQENTINTFDIFRKFVDEGKDGMFISNKIVRHTAMTSTIVTTSKDQVVNHYSQIGIFVYNKDWEGETNEQV